MACKFYGSPGFLGRLRGVTRGAESLPVRQRPLAPGTHTHDVIGVDGRPALGRVATLGVDADGVTGEYLGAPAGVGAAVATLSS